MSTPREEAAIVSRMAYEMQAKLAQHSDRPHWRTSEKGYLFERMVEEGAELLDAINRGTADEVWAEAADVANFAAMLADSCSADDRLRCHSGRWVTADCPHRLEACPRCQGEGWLQDDPHKPGYRCPNQCDDGVLVST